MIQAALYGKLKVTSFRERRVYLVTDLQSVNSYCLNNIAVYGNHIHLKLCASVLLK